MKYLNMLHDWGSIAIAPITVPVFIISWFIGRVCNFIRKGWDAGF